MVVFSNLIHRLQKNYSDEKQIRQSERAVTGYFDYIEDLIERENVFTMEEFSKSVNEFLAFRRYDILRITDVFPISRQWRKHIRNMIFLTRHNQSSLISIR